MSTYQASMAEQLSRLLSTRELELRQALQALNEDNESASLQEVSDFKEVALRSNDAAFDERQATRIEQAARRVEAARQRLVSGHYGQCLACGQAIDLRRLLALPEAELCMDCQRQKESLAH